MRLSKDVSLQIFACSIDKASYFHIEYANIDKELE